MTSALGLPDHVRLCLFDLDGVLTRTAAQHTSAWKEMFDAYLQERATRTGESFVPFDAHLDYTRYVDGKPRQDGTRDFLLSRGIELPLGEHDDGPEVETVWGLSARKNELVHAVIARDGVETFPGSIAYVRAVHDAGLRTAVVSSSANTSLVLDAAGIGDLFEVRVDGVVARERGLPGKPAPDTFLAAAEALDAAPTAAAVFEDAVAGVEAGAAGGFGWVVGVDREGHPELLAAAGAHVVVADLGELRAAG